MDKEKLSLIWGVDNSPSKSVVDEELNNIKIEDGIQFPPMAASKRRTINSKKMTLEKGFFTSQVGNTPGAPDGLMNTTYYNLVYFYEGYLASNSSLLAYGYTYIALGCLSFVFAIIFIAYGYARNTFKVPVYTDFYEWNANSGSFLNPQKCSSNMNVIGMMGFVFLIMSVFFWIQGTFMKLAHDIILATKDSYKRWKENTTGDKGYFREEKSKFFWDTLRDSGVNFFRWINFSFSTGLFIWILGLVVGMTNVLELVFLWALVALFYSCWFASEYQFKFHAPLAMWETNYIDMRTGASWLYTGGSSYIIGTEKPREPPLGEIKEEGDEALRQYREYRQIEESHHNPFVKWIAFFLSIFFGVLVFSIVTAYFIAAVASNPSGSPWIVSASWSISLIFLVTIIIIYGLRYPIKVFQSNVLLYELLITLLDFVMKVIVGFMILGAGHQDDYLGFGIVCT